MVGGADPDRHGAVVYGTLTNQRGAALRGYSDLIFEVKGQLPLDFDPSSGASLLRMVGRLKSLPVIPVAVEACLRGGPAGNVRGIVVGALAYHGCLVAEARVIKPGAWWQTARLNIPGAGPVVCAAETIKRWVVGLDLEAVPGRVGSDARAMHQAGLMQAACIARWFAIQRRETP